MLTINDHVIHRSVLNPPDLAIFDELVSPKEAEMLMERNDGKSLFLVAVLLYSLGLAHGSLLTAIKGYVSANAVYVRVLTLCYSNSTWRSEQST